jgi:His-Xaa-Ser system protein HxsD
MNSEFNNIEFDEQHKTAIMKIDKCVYSKGALLRTIYWLGKDLHSPIIEDKNGHFIVRVDLKISGPTLKQPKVKAIEEWIPEIFDVLLDSQLRVEIQAETSNIRELILAKAFAESGVLEDPPPGTFVDPVEAHENVSETLIQISAKPQE